VGKCAALLRKGVAVSIVDVVTVRHAEVMAFIGHPDPALAAEPPAVYASSCRWVSGARRGLLEAWTNPLVVAEPLPPLPLWLAGDVRFVFELERSYEQACEDVSFP
jgi:hypothetical protein